MGVARKWVRFALTAALCAAGPARADLATTFLSNQGQTFSASGDWWTQGFTVNQTTRFRLRFAADYSAQAGVITPGTVSSFQNNGGYSGYGLFSGQFGTKAVTLGPGTYYLGMRSNSSAANVAAIELDYDRVPSGYRLLGKVFGAARTVPAGGKLYQTFTLQKPTDYTYYIDGCNSGSLETFIIPRSQLTSFLNGNAFRFYTSYYSNTGEAPGLWHVRLKAGNYALVFRSSASIPKAVTYEMLKFRRIGP